VLEMTSSSSELAEFSAVGGDLSQSSPATDATANAVADAANGAGWPGGTSGIIAGGGGVYTTQIIGDPLVTYGAGSMNEANAMTLPAFFRGVRFLAESLAGFPKEVVIRESRTLFKADDGHPLNDLLNCEPNGLTTAHVFWEVWFHHAIVFGDAYALVMYGPDGTTPTELFNIPPGGVIPYRYEGQQYYAMRIIDEYATADRKYLALPASNVLHLTGFGVDGMTGYPIVRQMADALRVGKSAERYSNKFFQNGAHGQTVLTRDKDDRGPNSLTKEQVADLKNQMEANHAGVENSWRQMILPPGVKAENMAIPNDAAQMLETKKFSILDVARILGVEPFVLYDYGEAKWANIEAQNTTVVQYSLMPWVRKAEQEINRVLLTRAERADGYRVRFNVDDLIRGDHSTQLADALKRVGSGLTTPDEERNLMGLAAYPDGVGATPRFPVQSAPPAAEEPAAKPQETP
jgi:HK97 family phage portal protein